MNTRKITMAKYKKCSNHLDSWVAGFTRKLGAVSSTMAELWTLKDGLLLAKQLNFRNINVELDAKFIVHLLSDPNSVNLMLKPLLNDCRTLINSIPNCTVTHIFWEANRCANIMAKMGADLFLASKFCMNHCLWWIMH